MSGDIGGSGLSLFTLLSSTRSSLMIASWSRMTAGTTAIAFKLQPQRRRPEGKEQSGLLPHVIPLLLHWLQRSHVITAGR